MAKRKNGQTPALNDWHLWTEVTRSVSPIARRAKVVATPIDKPAPKKSAPIKDGGKLFRDSMAIKAGTSSNSWAPGTTSIHHANQPPTPHSVIEPRMHRRVRRGQVPIDGRLDLHGLRQDEARSALHRFIDARVKRGDRTILVITGKGLKKTGPGAITERGVLRHMLPIWLNEPSLSPLIAGYEVSARQHGGEGAYYVRLKRVNF